MAIPAIVVTLLLLVSGGIVSALSSGEAEPAPAPMSESLQLRLADASASDRLAIIVQYDSFRDRDEIDALGLPVAYRLYSIPADLVWATPAQVQRLAATPGVLFLEHNDPLEYDMETAVVAGNVAALWGENPSITINGTKIDGKGITLAVVDTGVNAAHDDIKYRSKTVRNLLAVTLPPDPTRQGDPFTGAVLRFEDSENSDGGGHGSHVAGIVAGDGTLSEGRIRGSAPGASLVGIGSQNANFWYAVAAWDWVFQNHDKVTPHVRIITNSWGYATGVPCDPNISLTKIQKRLVLEADVAMFFSAGNTGGDGTRDVTRTQFKCPWEGNIGVGNYFDNNDGTRDGYQSNSSSRGKRDDPTTWPDISAPGTQILATKGEPATAVPSAANPTPSFLVSCSVMRTLGQGSTGCYTSKSGTSMSTPFAAGVGALVLQARPDLKPADLEYILEQSARKFNRSYEDQRTEYYADPARDYRHHGSHYFKGHGLIDAEAAVRFALNYAGEKSPVVHGELESPTRVLPGRVRAVPATAEDGGSTPATTLLAAVGALAAALVLVHRRR